MDIMYNICLLAGLLAAGTAAAGCPGSLPVQGVQSVDNCVPLREGCVPAAQALHDYVSAAADDSEELLSIAMHGSPWHLFDPQHRIMRIEDVARMVRQQGSKVRRVQLQASWSGVAPDARHKTLAQQLSDALGGLPVAGQGSAASR